ncbi:hypothetical protein [Marinobacter adhaerens]|uniref:hypothetical protein n=1 Tax=Marinobacter adhaerens TaxID=1033846 RepID=UPI003BAAE523
MITLTDQHIATLRCAGRQGKTFEQACKEVGACRKVVRQALARQELEWELKDVFPAIHAPTESGITGMRKLRPEQICGVNVDTGLLHVRAATMAWRKCA